MATKKLWNWSENAGKEALNSKSRSSKSFSWVIFPKKCSLRVLSLCSCSDSECARRSEITVDELAAIYSQSLTSKDIESFDMTAFCRQQTCSATLKCSSESNRFRCEKFLFSNAISFKDHRIINFYCEKLKSLVNKLRLSLLSSKLEGKESSAKKIPAGSIFPYCYLRKVWNYWLSSPITESVIQHFDGKNF